MEETIQLKGERSLVFVKPGNEITTPSIFKFLEEKLADVCDFKRLVDFLKIFPVPMKQLEVHYANISQLPIYEATLEAYKNCGITMTIYQGLPGLISEIRRIVGSTDPRKADLGTIRREFSKDSLEEAFRTRRYLNNVIHASGNKADAEREIAIWLPVLYERNGVRID
jgi:nucleoside-diphosphate kinase